MIFDKIIFMVLGVAYQLISFEIEETQDDDDINVLPLGSPKVSTFKVRVKSNGDRTLHKALRSSTQKISGSIDFMASGALIDQIVFDEPTYCIGHTIKTFFIEGNGKRKTPTIIEEVSLITQSKNLKWKEKEKKEEKSQA